jgi:hypothetical protein
MPPRFFALSLLFVLPAYAVEPGAPVPDPRLEPHLSRLHIAEAHRSVELGKTLPEIEMPSPGIEDPQLVQLEKDIFVERRLVPQARDKEEAEAVRVYPRDAH